MNKKIRVDDIEFDLEKLSTEARATVELIKYTELRMFELSNITALLQRAKKSYIKSIKKEMLSEKSGFFFGED